MNIALAQNAKGDLLLVSDTPFEDKIIRVEYYREQKLLNLVYDNPEIDSELMHYEISDISDDKIKHAARIILIVGPQNDKESVAYDVPLIQIGI